MPAGSFNCSRCSVNFFCNAELTNETGIVKSPTLNSVGSKGHVAILRSKMTSQCYEYVFTCNLCSKLPSCDISFQLYFIAFALGRG